MGSGQFGFSKFPHGVGFGSWSSLDLQPDHLYCFLFQLGQVTGLQGFVVSDQVTSCIVMISSGVIGRSLRFQLHRFRGLVGIWAILMFEQLYVMLIMYYNL